MEIGVLRRVGSPPCVYSCWKHQERRRILAKRRYRGIKGANIKGLQSPDGGEEYGKLVITNKDNATTENNNDTTKKEDNGG